MQCGLPDGVLYDAVLVGLDKVGDVALIKLLPKKEGKQVPLRRAGRQRQGQGRRLVAGDGQPVPAGHRLHADGDLRPGQRRPPLPVPGRHAAGIHRLHPDRHVDQPRQLRRPAVQHGRRADRHQRPRLVREARPGQLRRRLRHLDQPDQELPGPPAGRPRHRPRHRSAPSSRRETDEDGAAQDDRHARSSTTPTPPAAAWTSTTSWSRSPAGRSTSVNQFKNVLGIYPQGLARCRSTYRREQREARNPGPADGRAAEGDAGRPAGPQPTGQPQPRPASRSRRRPATPKADSPARSSTRPSPASPTTTSTSWSADRLLAGFTQARRLRRARQAPGRIEGDLQDQGRRRRRRSTLEVREEPATTARARRRWSSSTSAASTTAWSRSSRTRTSATSRTRPAAAAC